MSTRAVIVARLLPGKTEEEARSMIEAAELRYRVTARDDQRILIDAAIRLDRISLRIEQGVVKEANVG